MSRKKYETENSNDNLNIDPALEENDNVTDNSNETSGKGVMIGHIVILAAIFVILGFSIWKLVIWNSGTGSNITSDSSDVPIEAENEDYIIYADESLQAEHEDGVTTVLMLGDNILSDYQESDGVANQLADLTGATVYDCSFSNMRLASQSPVYDATIPNDAFSFYYLANCIATKDYTTLYENLPTLTGADDSFTDTIETLEGLDFDKIDVITILYGPSDYLNGKLVSNPGDTMDIASYSGAIASGVSLLQEAYPHIRIVFVSPNYCMTTDENGASVSSDLYSNDYGRLVDYMIAAKNVAVEYNFTFLDNYWGLGINSANYEDYLEDNYLYPNGAGRTLVAQRIAEIIGVSDTQTDTE